MLTFQETKQAVLSHILVPAGPIPTAQDSDGVYPYESFMETSQRPILKTNQFVSMENDFLKVTICPDKGGQVSSIRIKPGDVEVLFVTGVVRPTRILPRYFYTAGAIEVSFPISHTPVQTATVQYRVERRDDRIYIWCGERELRFGMHWTVEYSLGENDRFLTQRTVFYNPTQTAHPWMSWSNAGIPSRPDTEIYFPNGPVLYHGDVVKTIQWEKEGPQRQSDIDRMIGFFWREPDCCAFGAYTPSLKSGLYHVADPALTPGIKFWTYGLGKHEIWAQQSTLDGKQYLEIQAGPLMDQSIKDHLQPGQQRHHVEFWFPTNQPMNIRTLGLPEPRLLDMAQVPRFGWARSEDVSIWEQVTQSFRNEDAASLPQPPGLDNNRWAPSGMDDLGTVLGWVIAETDDQVRDAWRFQLGAWHAGRDEMREAVEILQSCEDGRGLALAGRLYRRSLKDAHKAVECFRKIKAEVIACHPQVVVERDLTLAMLGNETLSEREGWLSRVRALPDERIIERRASLLAAQGKWEEARTLLTTTNFQLTHQRYARTRLWKRIKEELKITTVDPPNFLGEDDLADFGAYREYEEEDAVL
jgi:hypothetical protein